MSKTDIEKSLKDKGDFVKIDHLTRILNNPIPTDIKKFVYLKLAEVYEKRFMFNNAAKMYEHIAIISIAFFEKIKYHLKEAEILIKTGDFNQVENAVKKAMHNANIIEKQDIYYSMRDLYKKQAEVYERDLKRNHASKIYEKLLEMNLSAIERDKIKEKLLNLYEKLGKFKEASHLKKFGKGNCT